MRGVRDLARLVSLARQGNARLFSSQADILTAASVPGIDPERKVYIYAPSKAAGQHGLACTVEGKISVRWKYIDILKRLHAISIASHA